jgi:hypothetical protein
MASRLGDFPTRKLDRAELARFARDADERARQGVPPDLESTTRLVSAEPALELDIDFDDPPPPVPIATPLTDATTPSEVRVVASEADVPALDSVPFVVVSREDLSWYTLDDEAQAVLAKIDGESTVEAILETVPIPVDDVLVILHELEEHHVIEFH